MSSGNTPAEEVWTVLRLLTWTADYLKKHGSSSARLDAEILLAYVLHCERVDLYVRFEQQPTPEERALFKDLIRERAAGKPVAYLVGKKEFYSLDFVVNENVLIPRPETEFLVMGLMDLAKEKPEGLEGAYTVCDVGTGSGNIAIASALQLKNSRFTALDISAAALEVTRQNAEKYSQQLGDRLTIQQSDLLSAFYGVDPSPQFDFIVSNPPYVGQCELGAELEENVYRYEPHVALFGGERGYELISQFLPQVPQFLKPDGHFLMELSPMIHDAVVAMFPNAGLQYLKTIRDLDQNARIVVAKNEPW